MSSPNMNLTIPVPTVTSGPEYAENISDNFTLIDTHNHTTGQGVKIPVDGLNINGTLSLNGNAITSCAGVTLNNQVVVPASGTVYSLGGNLYFQNGANQVQITNGASIAAAAGNITNLVSPASVTWDAGSVSYVFKATGTTYADLDAKNILLRNSGSSPYKTTLLPSSAMATDYNITLPIPPAVSSFLAIDGSGVISNTIPTSLGIDTANIANSAITDVKLATDSVTTIKIQNAAVTEAKKDAGTYISYTVNIAASLVGNNTWQTISTIGTLTTTQAYRLAMMGFKNADSSYSISIAVAPGNPWYYRIVVTGPSGYTNYLYLTNKDINAAAATTNLEDNYNWLTFPSCGPLTAWPVNVMQSLTLPSVGTYTFTLQFKGPFSNPQWYNYIAYAQLGS